jgi:polyphosphate kinase
VLAARDRVFGFQESLSKRINMEGMPSAVRDFLMNDAKDDGGPDLDDPSVYLNRELNRLEFIKFVLTEAMEEGYHPLLERVKFLSIF